MREKNCEDKAPKVAETKTETNSEEVDDPKSVLSDITFTVAAYPAIFQAHSASATKSIQEDPTIKGISFSSGARMQVLDAATPSAIDTITIEIPKS